MAVATTDAIQAVDSVAAGSGQTTAAVEQVNGQAHEVAVSVQSLHAVVTQFHGGASSSLWQGAEPRPRLTPFFPQRTRAADPFRPATLLTIPGGGSFLPTHR